MDRLKKNIKIISIFLLFLCLSGCTANVNYKINADNSITENGTVNITFISSATEENKATMFETAIIGQKSALENGEFNYTKDSNNYLVKTTNTYTDCADLSKRNSFIKNLYNGVECSTNNGISTIKTTGYIKGAGKLNNSVTEATISIEIPYEVTSNNADSVIGYTYTWNIDTKIEKDISISYNLNNNMKQKEDSRNSLLIVIGIGIGIMVIIISAFTLKNNFKRRNEI